MYLALKDLHVACVILSISGFALRGGLMLADSPILGRRWVRTLPHAVDSLLLASAIALAVLSQQYPFEQSWLTAKLIALPIYVVCGALALRPGRSKAVRTGFLVGALLVVAYIVSVALTRDPAGFFA